MSVGRGLRDRVGVAKGVPWEEREGGRVRDAAVEEEGLGVGLKREVRVEVGEMALTGRRATGFPRSVIEEAGGKV